MMGGIYAREEGLPEPIWKAIYYQYLPMGVEADAPPSRAHWAARAATWAAVSLADKLDTVVGLFSAGEKVTGSRDPSACGAHAQGVVKILVDLPELGFARPRLHRESRRARSPDTVSALRVGPGLVGPARDVLRRTRPASLGAAWRHRQRGECDRAARNRARRAGPARCQAAPRRAPAGADVGTIPEARRAVQAGEEHLEGRPGGDVVGRSSVYGQVRLNRRKSR